MGREELKSIKFTEDQLKVFEEIGVKIVYVFGSQASGYSREMSDIDIGIVLEDFERYRNNSMEPYLKMYDVFTDIFSGFKEVDIVLLQFASSSLQFNALKEGVAVYCKDKRKELDYREQVFKEYCDFEYYLNIKHKAIFERCRNLN